MCTRKSLSLMLVLVAALAVSSPASALFGDVRDKLDKAGDAVDKAEDKARTPERKQQEAERKTEEVKAEPERREREMRRDIDKETRVAD